MGKDYYGILELDRTCSHIDIQKNYRRLGLRWHPDKHSGDPTTAWRIFHEISEAYEVLNNPQSRAFFDQYGEERLKQGIVDIKGRFVGGYRYSGNAEEIFNHFTGTSNPFFDEQSTEGGRIATMFGSAFNGLQNQFQEENPDLHVSLTCTLEELYNGTMKCCIYTKRCSNPDQKTTSDRELKKLVQIHPGYSNSTILKFSGEGNEYPGQANSDLYIQIQETSHSKFRREENILHYKAKINLLQALEACSVEVETLDQRILSISMDQIISPSTKKVVRGEGMPVFSQEHFSYVNEKGNEEKGDLVVTFDIEFPKYVAEQDLVRLRQILQ